MTIINLYSMFITYLIVYDGCILLYQKYNRTKNHALYIASITSITIYLAIWRHQFIRTSFTILNNTTNKSSMKILGVICITVGLAMIVGSIYERIFKSHYIEGTPNVIKTNIYHCMRHPQYIGTTISTIGISLYYNNVVLVLLSGVITGMYYVVSKTEEKQLMKQYNEEYIQYMNKTKQLKLNIKEIKIMKQAVYITVGIIIIEAILLLVIEKGYIVTWIIFAGALLGVVLTIIAFVILAGIQGVGAIFGKTVLNTTVFKSAATILVGSGLIASLQLGVSEWMKHTPNTVEHASIEEVTINGRSQYITVRSENVRNPVILFLAGGPGGSQVQPTRMFLNDLEEDYTVVNWEQPGSGMSYNAYDTSDITVDTYIEDAHELTTYLKQAYNQDKIYIIGESWGSYLAIELATNYPEDYHAIITTGQMVDFMETEIYCYNKALEIAREDDDKAQVQALLDQGLPPYEHKNMSMEMGTYLMYLHQKMARSSEINHVNHSTFDQLFSHEYSIMDSINFLRALYFTFDHVYRQLLEKDLRQTHTSIPVPIYILHGEHDVNAPLYLVEDYFDQINAPRKELIIFKESGHNPWITESEKFVTEFNRIAFIEN